MIINTPVSLGELIDKISILEIKKKNIEDIEKQKLINAELAMLDKVLEKVLGNNSDIAEYLHQLIEINTKLLKIEDRIRECERQNKFDKEFIELARGVYFTNDERSKVKLEINKKFGSQIIEVKSYKKY